jgi:hypothetical protein
MGIAFKGLSLGKALGQVVPVAAERLGSACCRISSNMIRYQKQNAPVTNGEVGEE